MAAVDVKDLYKSFRLRLKPEGKSNPLRRRERKTVQAVDGITFTVEPGELLAFIGPNGAGKSTTIKLLTGILYPDSGSIEVLGIDPHKQRKELAYRIGTVFGQKSQLWFHLPPGDSFRLNYSRTFTISTESKPPSGSTSSPRCLGSRISSTHRYANSPLDNASGAR